MKMLLALLISIGVGYIAELYVDNPQPYVVWIGVTIMTFGAYAYLFLVTSLAFSLPVILTLSIASWLWGLSIDEPGFIIFGIYAAMGILIFIGGRFQRWTWKDWRNPRGLLTNLTTSEKKR